MAKLVQDEAGNIFSDEGGGILTPVTEEQARTIHENQGAGQNFTRSANLALTNMGTAAMSLLSDDPKWAELNRLGHEEAQALQLAQPTIGGLGALAPQIAAGVATAGFGPIAAGATEAGLGALSAPEGSRVQGAVIGGLGGAAGALLPGAANYAGRKGAEAFDAARGRFGSSLPADDLVPGVLRPEARGLDEAISGAAEGSPPPSAGPAGAPLQVTPGQAATDAAGDLPLPASRNPPGAAPDPGPSMAQRQAAALEGEARTGQNVAGHRVMGDLMTPEELAQYNIPTNPGQRYALEATTSDPGAFARARQLMDQEEAYRSSPAMGRKINEVMDRQKAAGTNFINDQFGVPQGIALTDGTISEQMAYLGNRFDAIAEEMGGVPITKVIRDELGEVMRLSSGRHTSRLQAVIDDTLKKADNNSGMLTGQDWMTLRTELNKQVTKGVRDGKIDWVNEANDVMDIFTRAMEDKLPAAAKAELRQLRKQYAIGTTLAKPGVRDPNGLVNPTSFYSNWKRPQSLKFRGKDDVGRFMNTIDFLQRKRVPDSGTAGRLLMNAEKTISDAPVVGPIYRGLLGQ